MSKLKKIIISKFASREGILDVRLKTARIFFVFCILLFTLNYFLVGAEFYNRVIDKAIVRATLPYTYGMFIFSMTFLAHLIITSKYLVKKPMVLSIALFFALLVLAGAAFAPLFLTK